MIILAFETLWAFCFWGVFWVGIVLHLVIRNAEDNITSVSWDGIVVVSVLRLVFVVPEVGEGGEGDVPKGNRGSDDFFDNVIEVFMLPWV